MLASDCADCRILEVRNEKSATAGQLKTHLERNRLYDSKAPWFGLLPSTELQDACSLLDHPAVRVLKVHRHHHLTGLRKAPVP